MKDWRTLTTEDGIIARYLLRLDAARIERWNRDLARLLQGGGTMSLRSEVKEAMAKAAEARGFSALAADIRAERTTQGVRCVEEDEATAVLAVLDQYEEVEVSMHINEQWAHFPCCGNPAKYQGNSSYKTRTIYMRKQKPDLEELARRAVKAWRRYVNASMASQSGEPMSEVMEALDKALDE